MLDFGELPACRVASSVRIDRAPFSAKACATKLYCPPTPLTTCPSSRPSETAAPRSVAIIVLLMKRASMRARRLLLLAIKLIGERHRHHLDARDLVRRHLAQRPIEGFW